VNKYGILPVSIGERAGEFDIALPCYVKLETDIPPRHTISE